MKIVLETEPRNLPALDITFVDKRIEKLLFNYRARNFPGTLDYAEQQRWLEHRRQVFTPEFLQGYAEEIQMLAQQYADDKEKVALLEASAADTAEDNVGSGFLNGDAPRCIANLLIIGDGMSFFCRPLWDCFCCLGAIKLNYQLVAAGHFCQCCFCFYEWKRTDLRHHIQLFNRHLYTLLNLPQQSPVAPYAAVEHTQARTQSRHRES